MYEAYRERYKTQYIKCFHKMTVREIERGLLFLLEQSILSVCSYLTRKKGFEITFLPTLPSKVCTLFNCGFFDVAIMFSARFLSRGHHSVSLVYLSLLQFSMTENLPFVLFVQVARWHLVCKEDSYARGSMNKEK